MSRKQELLATLKVVYHDWEWLLGTAADKQLVTRRVTSRWTLKDVVVHVMAWQQISIARLQAAMAGRDLELPAWLDGTDPLYHSEEHTRELNAKIHAMHDARPWPEVHRAWREGFTRFLELAEAIPVEALLATGRYSWLPGYALSDVLEGSCEHHREHLEAVMQALGIEKHPPSRAERA